MSSVLDHPLISQRYFFPRPQAPQAVWNVDVGDASLGCWKSDPLKGPVLLFFHGNGETVADYLPWWPQTLAQMGLSTVLAEYRGYGASTGTPTLSAMLDDGPRILDAMGVAPEQVIVFGRSVGSLFALHLASVVPQIGGLIIESGIANVLERLLIRLSPRHVGCSLQELEKAVQARFDHDHKLRTYRGPVLLMHADNDTLVDVSHAHRLANWAGDQAKLVVFSRGDHNSIYPENQEAYLDAMRDFCAGIPAGSTAG